MECKKITIGNKEYTVELAKTEEEIKKGLMDRDFLPPDQGMLFVFKEEGTREFWMHNTHIPLDQIAINDDDEVVMVYEGKPDDDTLVSFPNAKYILEVNTGSGIKEGDEFDISDEDLDKYVMKVLAPDGSVLMALQGGERIFSRISTRTMIKKAKRAWSFKNNDKQFRNKCISLGKYIFKELYALDHRNPEYVTLPDKKESSEDDKE